MKWYEYWFWKFLCMVSGSTFYIGVDIESGGLMGDTNICMVYAMRDPSGIVYIIDTQHTKGNDQCKQFLNTQ